MKTASLSATLVAVVLLVLGSATGASASDSSKGDVPPPDNQPDRVIYVDHPAPRLESKQVFSDVEKGQAYVAEESEFPVIPAAGETVRVIYTDAITDVTTEASTDAAAAASCTMSITVNTPYKSNNRAGVSGSAMVSSGCGGGRGFTLRLYGANYERANNSVTVPNTGNWWTISAVAGTCATTSNMGYYGIGTFSAGGGSVWGPSATLSCWYW